MPPVLDETQLGWGGADPHIVAWASGLHMFPA